MADLFAEAPRRVARQRHPFDRLGGRAALGAFHVRGLLHTVWVSGADPGCGPLGASAHGEAVFAPGV